MPDDYLRAFVKRGKNRQKILRVIGAGEKTQAEIYHITGIYRSHVVRTLSDLEQNGLVKCLNPRDRIYKMYVLTDKGKRLLRVLQ